MSPLPSSHVWLLALLSCRGRAWPGVTHVRTCLGLVVVDGKRVGSPPSVSHSRRCGQSPAAAAVAQSTAVGMIGNVTKGAYPPSPSSEAPFQRKRWRWGRGKLGK